jgi:hypothetical protein
MCHPKLRANTKLGRILNVPYKTTMLMILVISVDSVIKQLKKVEVK